MTRVQQVNGPGGTFVSRVISGTPSIAQPASVHALSPAIVCWNCVTLLGELTSPADSLTCSSCGIVTHQCDGIWRALSPGTAAEFQRFIEEYEFIRAAESRGSQDSSHYLSLPEPNQANSIPPEIKAQWRIRALTFRYLQKHIIVPLATRLGRPLRILDLGAGNAWLSYRLSLLGHSPVAVDLITNQLDGLAAARHYTGHLASLFPRVQASLVHLPFESGAFDLAIFNASFHYSTDFTKTLAEALRCITPAGSVVIADSPWYQQESSGQAMVAEKRSHFLRTYGFASNSIKSREFLTPKRLETMAFALDVTWRTFKPFYGLQWSLRPLRAWLQRRRTPSQFRIFLAQVNS